MENYEINSVLGLQVAEGTNSTQCESNTINISTTSRLRDGYSVHFAGCGVLQRPADSRCDVNGRRSLVLKFAKTTKRPRHLCSGAEIPSLRFILNRYVMSAESSFKCNISILTPKKFLNKLNGDILTRAKFDNHFSVFLGFPYPNYHETIHGVVFVKSSRHILSLHTLATMLAQAITSTSHHL